MASICSSFPNLNFMDEAIIKFLKLPRLANICFVDEDGAPYCFNCFVAYDKKNGQLYFKTSPRSHHAQVMQPHAKVAGTLLPDKLSPLFTTGIQFKATVLDGETLSDVAAAQVYHKRYPFALAISGDIWGVQLEWIKLTENNKGIKRNLTWEREATAVRF